VSRGPRCSARIHPALDAHCARIGVFYYRRGRSRLLWPPRMIQHLRGTAGGGMVVVLTPWARWKLREFARRVGYHGPTHVHFPRGEEAA
jgi:hypothetical protein